MKITKLMMAHAENIKKYENIKSELLNICRKCGHPQGYHSTANAFRETDLLQCPQKGFKWKLLGDRRGVHYARNTFVLHNEASEIFKLYLLLLGMVIKED